MLSRPRSPRDQGFTILEILIAIVVLVLGISGIVSLFPTAIESGNKTVQDSYAAAITQSVIDALSVGLREARYHTAPDAQGRVWTYFVLDHDGVWDRMAPTPQDYASSFQNGAQTLTVAQADWCILLPQGPDQNTDSQREPFFDYPSVRALDGLGGGPSCVDDRSWAALPACFTSPQAFDDWDARLLRSPWNDGGARTHEARRVYHLGRYRKGQERGSAPSPDRAPGAIRDEFLGEPQGPGATTATAGARGLVDPYPQYSFSLSIRRAKTDNHDVQGRAAPDGKITREDAFSSSLYEVRVFVYRNFDSDPGLHQALSQDPQRPIPRTNCPIREFVTLLSL